MPRRDDIHKVLIIGSGPVVVGQAGEYDSSGTRACRALRSLGYKVVVINPNPATIMTDPDTADATYIEPLNVRALKEIIAFEHPDALLPNMGGQAGLNLSAELHEAGILDEYGIKLIGVNSKAIKRGEDRLAFREAMDRLGIERVRSTAINAVADAEKVAEEFGYPVVIRPSYTMAGSGSGLVYNVEELKTVVTRGLANSRINQVLVEESVLGWEELELEVVRDAKNQMVTVSFIENIDAMGIHTGDSCCTVPMLTVSPELQEQLQAYARAIMEAFEIVGGAGIQFAHNPGNDRIMAIEINPRASRSSVFASRATGFPVAEISALLAGGLTLDEIPYRQDRTLEKYAPSGDHVAVKLPCWDFEKFEGLDNRLDTQMLSVGEAMGIGKTFKEALQKAIRSLGINRFGLGFVKDFRSLSLDRLLTMVGTTTSERLFIMYEALCKGADIKKLHELSQIKTWFIEQMKELVLLEEEISAYTGSLPSDNLLLKAKEDGFADRYLATLLNVPETDIREKRIALGVVKGWETVPVSGVKDAAYYFSTHNAGDRVKVSDRRKIMVLGSGPNRIGQSLEFDYCCVQAAGAIQDADCESIMVNCNPQTVSTDHDISGRLYFEPLTTEDVLSIYEKEKPEGVIVQLGGQVPRGIAGELSRAGIKIMGTSPETIALTENRDRIHRILKKLGIPQPESGKAGNREEAETIAGKIGYPLLIRRPIDGIDSSGVEIVQDEGMLHHHMDTAVEISPHRPILISKFLDNAIEAEADAITDGGDAFVPAVMEHIELAGIHSGDSACVIPPISIAPKHIETIQEYTRKIAIELRAVGLMNIQYAIYNNTVYVLEVTPGASRSTPIVSKVCNVPMARLATRVMLGAPLKELGLKRRHMTHYGIKESVFPFNMYHGVDPALGPGMHSTGEVLGLSHSFGRAIFKAQEATWTALPLTGTILFTIADRDKTAALEPARLFRELGFRIMATGGTHRFLKENGIETIPARKLGYGRPNLIDAIKNGEVNLLVDTPSGRQSSQDSSVIRRAAIKYKVPYITTTAATIAAAKGIAARREGDPGVRSLQKYHEGIL